MLFIEQTRAYSFLELHLDAFSTSLFSFFKFHLNYFYLPSFRSLVQILLLFYQGLIGIFSHYLYHDLDLETFLIQLLALHIFFYLIAIFSGVIDAHEFFFWHFSPLMASFRLLTLLQLVPCNLINKFLHFPAFLPVASDLISSHPHQFHLLWQALILARFLSSQLLLFFQKFQIFFHSIHKYPIVLWFI